MTFKLIYDVYQRELSRIKQSPIQSLQQTIDQVNLITSVTSRTFKLMRASINNNGFDSVEDEIYFFKYVMPDVISELKLSKCMKKHALKLTNSTKRVALNLIKNQIKKKYKCIAKLSFLTEYFAEELTNNDENWFTVSKFRLTNISVDWSSLLIDEYSTNMNAKVAKLRYCEKLIKIYKNQIDNKAEMFSNSKSPIHQSSIPIDKMKWTGTKSDFTELVYGLAKSHAINHGQVKLSEITANLTSIIDLGSDINIYSVFDEIKKRKKEPTKFINTIQQELLDEINK